MFRFQFSNIRKEQLHLQVIETRAHYRVYFCVFYHGNLAQYVLFGTWETSYKNAHKNKLYTRKCHGRPTFGVDKNVIWRRLVWRCFCFCLFCPPGLFHYLCLVKVLWLDFVFSLFCFIFWRHSYTCLFSSKNKDLSAVPDLMVLQRGYYTQDKPHWFLVPSALQTLSWACWTSLVICWVPFHLPDPKRLSVTLD